MQVVNRFQFLMVRLKVDDETTQVYLLMGFQFLMVRLKVIISIMCPSQKYIFQFLMVRLKGAMNFSNAIKDVFQFLMVRLKDYQMTSQATNNLISIPYGAIKSQCPFFMISLKLYHFNSLWCD